MTSRYVPHLHRHHHHHHLIASSPHRLTASPPRRLTASPSHKFTLFDVCFLMMFKVGTTVLCLCYGPYMVEASSTGFNARFPVYMAFISIAFVIYKAYVFDYSYYVKDFEPIGQKVSHLKVTKSPTTSPAPPPPPSPASTTTSITPLTPSPPTSSTHTHFKNSLTAANLAEWNTKDGEVAAARDWTFENLKVMEPSKKNQFA